MDSWEMTEKQNGVKECAVFLPLPAPQEKPSLYSRSQRNGRTTVEMKEKQDARILDLKTDFQ